MEGMSSGSRKEEDDTDRPKLSESIEFEKKKKYSHYHGFRHSTVSY